MTRPTTEGCMSIDVRSWHREGRLRPGQCFAHALTWMWEPTEEIEVLTKADAVVLVYRSRSWGGEYGPTIKQRIPIVWTPCTLGGRRLPLAGVHPSWVVWPARRGPFQRWRAIRMPPLPSIGLCEPERDAVPSQHPAGQENQDAFGWRLQLCRVIS